MTIYATKSAPPLTRRPLDATCAVCHRHPPKRGDVCSLCMEKELPPGTARFLDPSINKSEGYRWLDGKPIGSVVLPKGDKLARIRETKAMHRRRQERKAFLNHLAGLHSPRCRACLSYAKRSIPKPARKKPTHLPDGTPAPDLPHVYSRSLQGAQSNGRYRAKVWGI